MLAMLINNTLYYFVGNYTTAYIIDFIAGNSLIYTILLLMISFRFNYCEWHRLIIVGNFINITIASYDASFTIPFIDMQLLLTYYIINSKRTKYFLYICTIQPLIFVLYIC